MGRLSAAFFFDTKVTFPISFPLNLGKTAASYNETIMRFDASVQQDLDQVDTSTVAELSCTGSSSLEKEMDPM